MKLWKCVAITSMLWAAALFLFLTRAMVRLEPQDLQRVTLGPSSSQSPSSASSDPSLPLTSGRPRRTRRNADTFSSLLKEFSFLLQSFTEGELKQIIGTLVERKARREVLEASKSRRMKRARKKSRSCSLRHVDITVSDLGLGYQSDETLRFRYCSGGCSTHRRNYDITLEHMWNAGFLKEDKSGRTHYKPCCRPTDYDDDISFLDNNNKYHTIHNVSARQCGCV